MTRKIKTLLPVNRVEGDLDISLTIEDHTVVDAKAQGTMFRGIENVMTGRGPLDGLVITPRVCGICTTSHLYGAAKALDMAFGASVPDNGRRVRNITLMVEQIQNDMRHTFLLFMPDATNRAYSKAPFFDEAKRRYEPMMGDASIEVVRETKKLLEIIAVLGGQWPHSSFMVPGGVVCQPSPGDILVCRHLLRNFRRWYEQKVLGCSMDRWLEVETVSDLDRWLNESRSCKESELGFFIDFCRLAGLDRKGGGHHNFISFGSLEMPEKTVVSPGPEKGFLRASGFFKDGKKMNFSQDQITEDTTYSHLAGCRIPKHPFDGKTVSAEVKPGGSQYTWGKAPRYNGLPAETGPLAEALVNENPLYTEMVKNCGPTVLARQMARITRTTHLVNVIDEWLGEMISSKSAYFQEYELIDSCSGFGLVQAPRGALGHWVTLEGGKIKNYQIITPTAWNASPRDAGEVKGPMEEAIVGIEVKEIDNPVEVEHVVRSFDPCLVCTVH